MNYEQVWDLAATGQGTKRALAQLFTLNNEGATPELKICIARLELENLEIIASVSRAGEALGCLSNDSPWAARALGIMSMGYAELGYHTEGTHFAEEATRTKLDGNLGFIKLAAAASAQAKGCHEDACVHLAEAIRDFSSMGNTVQLVSAAMSLGIVRKEMGQFAAATRAFEIAQRHLHASQENLKERIAGLHAMSTEPLGHASIRQVITSISHAENHNYGRALFDHYADYGQMLIENGDFSKSVDISNKLSTLGEKTSVIKYQAIGLNQAAQCYRKIGDPQRARLLEEAKKQLRPTNKISESTRIHHTLIQLRKLNQRVQAQQKHLAS